MKISEWLVTVVGDQDTIHASAGLKADFRARTGYTPPAWREEVLAAVMEQHTAVYLNPDVVARDQVITSGHDVAAAIERDFIPGRRPAAMRYSGNGRNFDAIVETLRTVGL
jgi:hypothetical protein